jgi:hypothetical protein
MRDLICGMLADPVTRAAMDDLAPVAAPGAASDVLNDLHLRRERLIDLYTEGDIDLATFRSRQARLDDRIQAAKSERSSSGTAVPSIPSALEELAATWNASGIDYQRTLLEILVESVTVSSVSSRRRAFDPSRLTVALRA